MHLITQFARRNLADTSARLRQAVEAMPEDALTWQPTIAETNSIAQIVRHVVTGQSHILGLAAGDGPAITSMDPDPAISIRIAARLRHHPIRPPPRNRG